MARPENQDTVTGGLSFNTPELPEVPSVKQNQEKGKNKSAKTATLEKQKELYRKETGWKGVKEQRVRKQFTLPPSLNDKLKKAAARGEIESENALVMFLLDKWFAGELLLKEKEE